MSESNTQPEGLLAERFVVTLSREPTVEDTPRLLSMEEIEALRATKHAVSEYAARLRAERKHANE
ncbi:hypothetical protein KY495_16560 [Massilia sp. PAMC28688]|uniref:hypothetical protein n=1 Tax=Massilia sp. PAMC28688 TaxID=2861283 RepID=UPI001C62BDF2|nr:hypothetical protein [Massilia sp. PAMC28688]QYF92356.1 hypothetical protein KY495_16560 [Massilia sp. PAMC28688]